jgi:hypothetical protein
MDWKLPPRIKVYEALGAIADKRIELIENSKARVKSSSGSKSYDVFYDESNSTISANDNGSYWQGYLGYPAIAYLMLEKKLPFNESLSSKLMNIPWKEINQKHKNDFSKTESYLFKLVDQHELEAFASEVLQQIDQLHLQQPETKPRPPLDV